MKILKKAFLLIVSILMTVSLVACSARQAVSAIDFKAACAEVELIATEQNASETGEEGLTTLVTATGTGAKAEIIEYDNETSAKSLYASIVDSIKSDSGTVEKQVDSSTYSKFFQRTGDTYEAVVRIGSQIFYGQEDDASGIIESLLEKIGYN